VCSSPLSIAQEKKGGNKEENRENKNGSMQGTMGRGDRCSLLPTWHPHALYSPCLCSPQPSTFKII